MLPIFGVRNANTAFQDAQNLAWKLALVCLEKAPPELLTTYSHERVGAAREIIQEGGRSTRFMTPPTHGFRLTRNATLSLALQHAFVRPLFHWRTSRAHTYAESPLNASADMPGLPSEAGIGSVMANARLDDGSYLLDYLDPQYHLLICGSASIEQALHALTAAAVGALSSALLKAIDTPAVKERFQTLGLEAIPSTSQEMAAYAKAEREKWGKVIQSKGIKLD